MVFYVLWRKKTTDETLALLTYITTSFENWCEFLDIFRVFLSSYSLFFFSLKLKSRSIKIFFHSKNSVETILSANLTIVTNIFFSKTMNQSEGSSYMERAFESGETLWDSIRLRQ